MTREELKTHCIKQIENCEMWAKFHGEEPYGKVYEEHKLILELLDQVPCKDTISRQVVLEGLASIAKAKAKSDAQKSLMGRVMFFVEQLPPVIPQYTDAEIQKIQKLKKEPNTWSLDDAREDFTSDVYNTLDFLPTNEEANRIIDSFDRVTSNIEPQPCDDAISRQITSDYVGSHIQEINTGYGDLNKHTNEILRMIVDYIESMPPVTPQPKTGHWFIDERPESDRETICSNCEQPIFKYHKLDFDYRPKYCPNCGARMVEPQESE